MDNAHEGWTKSEKPISDSMFAPEAELSQKANEEVTGQCWYAGCNQGYTGPKRTTRAAALADARAHNSRTGHGAGVMGPTFC